MFSYQKKGKDVCIKELFGKLAGVVKPVTTCVAAVGPFNLFGNYKANGIKVYLCYLCLFIFLPELLHDDALSLAVSKYCIQGCELLLFDVRPRWRNWMR
jgi:hypothetical protein